MKQFLTSKGFRHVLLPSLQRQQNSTCTSKRKVTGKLPEAGWNINFICWQPCQARPRSWHGLCQQGGYQRERETRLGAYQTRKANPTANLTTTCNLTGLWLWFPFNLTWYNFLHCALHFAITSCSSDWLTQTNFVEKFAQLSVYQASKQVLSTQFQDFFPFFFREKHYWIRWTNFPPKKTKHLTSFMFQKYPSQPPKPRRQESKFWQLGSGSRPLHLYIIVIIKVAKPLSLSLDKHVYHVYIHVWLWLQLKTKGTCAALHLHLLCWLFSNSLSFLQTCTTKATKSINLWDSANGKAGNCSESHKFSPPSSSLRKAIKIRSRISSSHDLRKNGYNLY